MYDSIFYIKEMLKTFTRNSVDSQICYKCNLRFIKNLSPPINSHVCNSQRKGDMRIEKFRRDSMRTLENRKESD